MLSTIGTEGAVAEFIGGTAKGLIDYEAPYVEKIWMTDPKSDDDATRENSGQPASERVFFGDQAAHLAFQQQLVEMLSQADITEEQRQQILIAATCPCCGAGGLSISLDIKRDETPQF